MNPVLDLAVQNVLDLSSPGSADADMFLTAPVKWIDGLDGDLVAVGVGSLHGKERREKVATLHAYAAQNAFSPPGTPGVQLKADFLGAEYQALQNRAAEHPSVTNPVQPPPVANGTENAQSAPVTLQNEGFPHPINRETNEYLTPSSDPQELKSL